MRLIFHCKKTPPEPWPPDEDAPDARGVDSGHRFPEEGFEVSSPVSWKSGRSWKCKTPAQRVKSLNSGDKRKKHIAAVVSSHPLPTSPSNRVELSVFFVSRVIMRKAVEQSVACE